MNVRHPIAALSTAALVALSAAPAPASHGGIHPTFRETGVWFKCPGPTKLHQANWAANYGNASAAFAPWDATPPAGSVLDGEGCGAVDYGGTSNGFYSAVVRGTVVGNLRDMTVRIHNFLLNNAGQEATETLRLTGDIDGVPIFPGGITPSGGRTVEVTPVPGNSGATELYEFSITNLGYANEILDDDGKVLDVETGGVALEDGDGSRVHVLTLYIGLHGAGVGPYPDQRASLLVWDTTEVPSGITFNPASLAAARMTADLPNLS